MVVTPAGFSTKLIVVLSEKNDELSCAITKMLGISVNAPCMSALTQLNVLAVVLWLVMIMTYDIVAPSCRLNVFCIADQSSLPTY